MRRLRLLLTSVLSLGVLSISLLTVPVHALDVFNGCTGAAASSAVCQDSKTANTSSMVKKVINAILYILGAVAVIMIIYGGMRYTLSAGDAGAVKSAKNTILYAVVGLIVAIAAYSIVNFVITTFK